MTGPGPEPARDGVAAGDAPRGPWKTIIAFAIVGGVGTLAQYIVLYSLVRVAGLGPVVASTVGAMAGALINYLLNHRVTFRGRRSWRSTGPRYLAVVAIGFALNAALMAGFVDRLGLHYLWAQLVTTALCFLLNFLISNYWAFRTDDD